MWLQTPEYSVYCNESQIRITLGGAVSGTTYSWVRTIISGSIANGTPGSGTSTSEITQNLNAGGGGAFIRYIVTPTANGCTGEPDTAYVEFTNFDINRVFSITGTDDNETVCPGESVSYTLNSQNGNYYYTRFWWASDNPNIGLTSTGGPLNNNKTNNANISSTVSFTATNDTDIPQTANIVFSASAHDDGWASTFLCDVAAITRTITVEPFAIICPTDIAANTDANQCYATITRPVPALTCGTGANITWTAPGAIPASGNNGLTNVRFSKGVTTVTYRAQKSPTNYRVCSFTVTVTDNQPPVFSNCPPATTTLPMDPGQCGASFAFNPTATDNCDNPVTLVRTDGSGVNSGDIFPAGTTIISYLATDATGNTSTCIFNVTVQPDSQPPVITCVGNQAECASAGSGYTMLGTAWDATVTENCPGIVSKPYTLTGVTSGTGNSLNNVEFNVGTTTVTWTAKDANNITSTCNFDVVITQSPEVITSPLSQSVCLNGSSYFNRCCNRNTGANFPVEKRWC
ncbi:MAG: HYR domain-containing protein [Draconibacterium sp.]|nr:HYR domain-containing protein [Draconibacterium sp.]